MVDLKFSFPDQRFDVKPDNLKTVSGTTPVTRYFKMDYPADANPVFRYGDKLFYPVSITITKSDAANASNYDYNFYLETVSKVNNTPGNKLFVQMRLKHDTTAGSADGPLTGLFGSIAKTQDTTNGVVVNLTGLFTDAAVKDSQLKILKKTSEHLTLQVVPVISTNLNTSVSAVITDSTTIDRLITAYGTAEAIETAVAVIPAPLRQVNKCTRSSDNGSPSSFNLKNEINTSNIMSNIMVLTIVGLAMAAFFPIIYSGLVCIPAGDSASDDRYHAIHILYLLGSLSIFVPLIVRGFKDGDMDAQIWAWGILGIMVIFFWQFNHLSVKQLLLCNSQNVANAGIGAQISAFIKSLTWKMYIVLAALLAFMSAASSLSSKAGTFRGLVIAQAVLTLVGPYIFRF